MTIFQNNEQLQVIQQFVPAYIYNNLDHFFIHDAMKYEKNKNFFK